MRVVVICICVLVSTFVCASDQASTVDQNVKVGQGVPAVLSGTWTLQVENLRHEVVTTMTISFSDEQANSCIGGEWKRIVVRAHRTTNAQFFPVNEPLSYELNDNSLVIGRNGVCDAYLRLGGQLKDFKVIGEYVAFGLGGAKRLGYFSLTHTAK